MYHYYLITCETAFMGETQWYVTYRKDRVPSEEELHAYAQECAHENAMEWIDIDSLEENNMTEDEYYNEASYQIQEITKEEYEQWIDEGSEY